MSGKLYDWLAPQSGNHSVSKTPWAVRIEIDFLVEQYSKDNEVGIQ
jgi:hypothetical protein